LFIFEQSRKMERTAIKMHFASDEDYFAFEEKSETRHELINGNLYQMSGVSIFHNDIVLNMLLLLSRQLQKDKYKIAFESYKFRTPNGNYFYPDIMVCERDATKYYAEKPILIAEVLSQSTRKFNLVDKFLQYQKAEILQYYLCIEPEQQVVIFYFKTGQGEWMTETYTQADDVLNLPHLSSTITLKDIYYPA